MEFEFPFQEGSVCFWRLLRRVSFCWPYHALMGVDLAQMALCPFLEWRLQMELKQERIKKGKSNCLGSAW
jgi:hypothetical protein